MVLRGLLTSAVLCLCLLTAPAAAGPSTPTTPCSRGLRAAFTKLFRREKPPAPTRLVDPNEILETRREYVGRRPTPAQGRQVMAPPEPTTVGSPVRKPKSAADDGPQITVREPTPSSAGKRTEVDHSMSLRAREASRSTIERLNDEAADKAWAEILANPKYAGIPPSLITYPGGLLEIAGGELVVSGIRTRFPKLRLRRVTLGEAIGEIEDVLGAALDRKVLGRGATKTVYQHPIQPGKVVKVLSAGPSGNRERLLKSLQRELWLNDMLYKIEQTYIARGMKPPFRVARIDTTSAEAKRLLEHGVIIQEAVPPGGVDLGKFVEKRFPPPKGELPGVDRFLEEVKKYNRDVLEITRRRFDEILGTPVSPELRNPVTGEVTSSLRVDAAGIDLGADWTNVKYTADGELWIYDY